VDEWSDWESGDFLHATDEPGAAVPLVEVLHRIVVGFRRVVIDWTEGDRWVDWRIAKHTEIGSPPVIMDAEHSLRRRTALVSLAEEAGPDAVWVRFFLIKHDTASLDLNYQPATAAERGRALAHKLAELLGYRFGSADDPPPEEEEEGPVHDFLIHRNGLPNAEGRLPTAKAPLPLEEILRRVADRFPLAIIDRERGDQIVRAGAEARAAFVGSPTDPSVERHLALLGKVAHVTIRDSVDGPHCCFFLNPNLIGTGMQIEYQSKQDRIACRPLLKALVAELADYYCMTQDLDSETENLDD
jgi:hypothetical protein